MELIDYGFFKVTGKRPIKVSIAGSDDILLEDVLKRHFQTIKDTVNERTEEKVSVLDVDN